MGQFLVGRLKLLIQSGHKHNKILLSIVKDVHVSLRIENTAIS